MVYERTASAWEVRDKSTDHRSRQSLYNNSVSRKTTHDINKQQDSTHTHTQERLIGTNLYDQVLVQSVGQLII